MFAFVALVLFLCGFGQFPSGVLAQDRFHQLGWHAVPDACGFLGVRSMNYAKKDIFSAYWIWIVPKKKLKSRSSTPQVEQE
jgi:hypothetical protein